MNKVQQMAEWRGKVKDLLSENTKPQQESKKSTLSQIVEGTEVQQQQVNEFDQARTARETAREDLLELAEIYGAQGVLEELNQFLDTATVAEFVQHYRDYYE